MTARDLVMVCDVDVGRPDATRTHTLEVARLLAGEGFAVELVARGPDPGLPGAQFRCAGLYATSMPVRLARMNIAAIAALRAHRRGARLCYVRHYWSLVPMMLVARALGYRIVAQVDDISYGTAFGRRGAGARSWLADRARRLATSIMGRSAGGIVAVTDGIKTILVRDYGVDHAKVLVLPNGVDIEAFIPIERAEAIERTGLDQACQYVVFTGLFAEWVDFDMMLGAFARLSRTHPRARLLLVGDGIQRKRVEELIAELGIADQVITTGFIRDRPHLRDLIACASVCMAAFSHELRGHIGVSPVKFAEYLAMARPVVAVELPGVRAMIEENRAGIVVPADVDAMAGALGRILDDPRLGDAMGQAGRLAAEAGYSWRSIVERTVPLLLGSSSRP